MKRIATFIGQCAAEGGGMWTAALYAHDFMWSSVRTFVIEMEATSYDAMSWREHAEM